MQLTAEQIKLVNIVNAYYSKAVSGELNLQLQTTAQVFAKMQSLYPSENYSPEDVYQVLEYLQFENIDSTEGTIKWLMTELK